MKISDKIANEMLILTA